MKWEHILYISLGSNGKCLGSKSMYRMENPKHVVFFNALIYVNQKRTWCGDLDLSKELPVLTKLSRLHPTAEILILSESCQRTNGFSGEPTFKDYMLKLHCGEYEENPGIYRGYLHKEGTIYES